jgi:hypothetical protein
LPVAAVLIYRFWQDRRKVKPTRGIGARRDVCPKPLANRGSDCTDADPRPSNCERPEILRPFALGPLKPEGWRQLPARILHLPTGMSVCQHWGRRAPHGDKWPGVVMDFIFMLTRNDRTVEDAAYLVDSRVI